MANFIEKGPGVFADPTIDFAFKRIFGTEKYKAATIGLLNAFIKDRHVSDVKFLNTELTEQTTLERKAVLDILCKDQDGAEFIVELQKRRQEHFTERTVFYASKLIAEQEGMKGDWDFSLAPTYVLAIQCFSFGDTSNGQFIYHFVSRDLQSNRKLAGSTEFIFLDLNEYVDCCGENSAAPPESFEEIWLYLLTRSKDMTEVPPSLAGNDIFQSYFEASKRAKFNNSEKQKYLDDMLANQDYINTIRYAKKEGREEGREEGLAEGHTKGLAEGRAEGRAEGLMEGVTSTARAMRENGLPIEMITKCTGLTDEQVLAL